MKVVSFVVAVGIATTIRFVCGYGCEKAPKTRSKKDECSRGNLFRVNSKLARSGQIPENTKICRKHKNQIEKADNRCSFPLDRHSKTLVPLPSRHFPAMDENGNQYDRYKPGSMWCTDCKKIGEELLRTSEQYMPPSKRKRVSIMFTTQKIA